jgi:hypothetical protein
MFPNARELTNRSSPLHQACESRVDFACRARLEDLNLLPEGASRRPQVLQLAMGPRTCLG